MFGKGNLYKPATGWEYQTCIDRDCQIQLSANPCRTTCGRAGRGHRAVRVALPAGYSLFEPIMNVEIHAPVVEYAGDLMGDLNGHRGRIAGMDTKGSTQIIRAQVPMAEMLNYQNDLTSMTQGRASFSMEFDHYDFVPQQQSDKIIAAAKAAKEGVEEEEE